VPVPDPALGEKMCACIVLKNDSSLSFSELIEFLKGKEIAKFKLPERLEIFDDLPVSSFGKVSKKKLAEMIDAHR
jgi:non-ribosomal peptide synthetase component E (peptide arylation enzyme)